MDMENKMHTWIIGCGDIGRRVAKLYKAKTLSGIVSSSQSIDKCELLSVKSVKLDLDSDYTLDEAEFTEASIYYFAPPPPAGVEDSRLKRFLSKLDDIRIIPKRFILISTTGVYGDSGGKWIDENTSINPQADRAIRRASAEKILQNWADKNNCETMILRVPGIYAEDRLPIERLKKGLPIVKVDEAGFTNRIHADDLAMVCKAAMECDSHNHIINVTDGNPSTMTDYFNHVADYAKLPRPPQISLQEAEQVLSAGMVSYLKESRKIKNEKMLDILDVSLKYPDLASCLA